MPKGTEIDGKLLAWLERNAPWLMKLQSEKVMWRVGLELKHGRLIGRSVDESLLAAASVLRLEYEDGNFETKPASQDHDDNPEEDDKNAK